MAKRGRPPKPRLMDDGRVCERCGVPLIRREMPSQLEQMSIWKKRRFCSRQCMSEVIQGVWEPGEIRWAVDENGCWIWSGSMARNGYGRYKHKGRQILAHRAVYEAEVGPIPDDLQVHHRCENRACVNPEHLIAMSMSEHCSHHEPWLYRKAYLAKHQSDNVTEGSTSTGAVDVVRPAYQ